MESIKALDEIRTSAGKLHTSEIRLDMQKAMQNDAAVFRSQESLTNGVSELGRVLGTWKDIGIKDRSMIWNSSVSSLLPSLSSCHSELVTDIVATQRFG